MRAASAGNPRERLLQGRAVTVAAPGVGDAVGHISVLHGATSRVVQTLLAAILQGDVVDRKIVVTGDDPVNVLQHGRL